MDQESNRNFQCFVPDSIRIEGTKHGKLFGTTFCLKDLFSVTGHVPSFGNARWRDTHEASSSNAPALSKLLAAGATLDGLAKMDQLAYSLVGNVGEGAAPINALYPDRFAGGSSSGSASAVAAQLTDFGIGTDTGGSIRIPAASCGLYSLRPTHGRIDITGALPLAQSFDTVGIFARDPQLLSKVFETLRDQPKPAHSTQRILLIKQALDLVESETAEVTTELAEQLARRLGVAVEVVTDTSLMNDSIGDLLARVQAREIWKNHSHWVEENFEYLDRDVQVRLEFAKEQAVSSTAEQTTDLDKVNQYRHNYTNTIARGTVAVIPVMAGLPPSRSSSADDLLHFRKKAFRLSAIASLTGSPEVVTPSIHSSSSLSYGVGIVGARDEDESLLGLFKLLR